MELIYKDLTNELIRCFFDVHNTLGVGYDEKAYHNALIRRFRKAGFDFRSKAKKTLVHRGCKIRGFEADFITFAKIILELKAIHSKFLQAHYVQIISELKLWHLRLGLLVNFGLQKVEIERIPFTEKPQRIHENYDYVKNFMNEKDRNFLVKTRDAILHVFEIHGLGYGESLYRKLIETELDFRRIRYQHRFPIEVSYEDEPISIFKMKPMLIENRLICEIKALSNKIDFYDITKIQSYLRALELEIGLIINFGKNSLEIRGVRA